MPEGWFKKDIRALCGMLDSWWVENRPLDTRRTEALAASARRMLAVPGARKEIVLSRIRSARAVSAERYRTNCETIGNQVVRFVKYGEPDELIERFTKFAREEDEAGRALEVLLHRVLREGLPHEVEAYDPVSA